MLTGVHEDRARLSLSAANKSFRIPSGDPDKSRKKNKHLRTRRTSIQKRNPDKLPEIRTRPRQVNAVILHLGLHSHNAERAILFANTSQDGEPFLTKSSEVAFVMDIPKKFDVQGNIS